MQVSGARFQVSGGAGVRSQETGVRMSQVRTVVHEHQGAVSGQPSAFSKTSRTEN